VWPAGVFVASLGIVRHLSFQRAIKVLNCPGHGTRFGKKAFPKGTFKARTSKQVDLFSISCLPYLGCPKSAPKAAFTPKRKTILLRVIERPAAAHFRIEHVFDVENVFDRKGHDFQSCRKESLLTPALAAEV